MSKYSKVPGPLSMLGKETCPHLGIREDPQTCLAYASEWNLCYHARRPAPVTLEHQRTTCLSPMYSECPVFQGEGKTRMPARLRRRNKLHFPEKKTLLFVLLTLVSVFGLWVVFQNKPGLKLPFLTNTSEGMVRSSASPSMASSSTDSTLGEVDVSTSVATKMTSPTLTPDLLQSPSNPKNCGFELEDRVELNSHSYVLHRVATGENVDSLAMKFDTSVQAIQAINYYLPSTLWANLVIIIPLGTSGVEDFPILEPYFILDQFASLSDLAAQVSISSEELMKYNGLDENCSQYGGWLLIPHLSKKNP